MKYEPVTVNIITIESEMQYKIEPMLHYKIQYPQFTQFFYQKELNKINCFYKNKAFEIQKQYEKKMYHEAIEQYEYSIANNFPFHMYEAIINYEITYNMNCTISLFYDKYEYTGGAHGSTVRCSDTWNIQCGDRIYLSQYFTRLVKYRRYIITMILKQIADQINSGDNWYFEDYRQLVIRNFNCNNYYLSREGIVIYFQQYDIAPYSSGILEFIIHYCDKIVLSPTCCKH